MPVVRVHGVDVDRVRFPAARYYLKAKYYIEFFRIFAILLKCALSSVG